MVNPIPAVSNHARLADNHVDARWRFGHDGCGGADTSVLQTAPDLTVGVNHHGSTFMRIGDFLVQFVVTLLQQIATIVTDTVVAFLFGAGG
jgi:hypothetical protein